MTRHDVPQTYLSWSLLQKEFTMRALITALTMTLATCSLFADESQVTTAGRDGKAESSPLKKIDWATFMQQYDMTFDRLPRNWQESPHFGNVMVGSMLYQAGDTIRLQVFRADVHDHRDDTFGWPAYSRARLQIGHFSLNPVGKLTGCAWRKGLWNAELTGTIKTDKGEIHVRHFTHAEDMAIVTELTPSSGEQGFHWTWHPAEAKTSRPGYPTKGSEIAAFAKKYGKHYADTLKVYKPNPAGRLETQSNVSVWVQDLPLP